MAADFAGTGLTIGPHPMAFHRPALALKGVRDVKVRKYLRMLQRPPEQSYFGIGRGFTDEILVDAFGPSARGGSSH